MFLELLYTLSKVPVDIGGDGRIVHEIRDRGSGSRTKVAYLAFIDWISQGAHVISNEDPY